MVRLLLFFLFFLGVTYSSKAQRCYSGGEGSGYSHDLVTFYDDGLNINEAYEKTEINIFPNPSNVYSPIHIMLKNSNLNVCILEVFDLKGNKILDLKMDNNRQIIKPNTLKSGVYILKINNNHVDKLIIL
jgi:hypothetical protein